MEGERKSNEPLALDLICELAEDVDRRDAEHLLNSRGKLGADLRLQVHVISGFIERLRAQERGAARLREVKP